MNFRALAVIPLFFLAGCASIMNGTNQNIGISSYPSNANVWVDNNFIGCSPTVLKLSRKNNHVVRIELEGYQPYEMALTPQVSGWVVGNLVFGGVIGLAVDAITGGLYKLTPEQIHTELQQGNISYTSKTDELYIAAVMIPNSSWEKVGNFTTLK